MTLTDENTQSQIDERRRKTGVETANEQRARRGDPAIEGGDELFDMNEPARPLSNGQTNTAAQQRKGCTRSAQMLRIQREKEEIHKGRGEQHRK